MVAHSRKRMHGMVYAVGLALLAAGMPSSIFLMSVSQIVLVLNWIAEGRYREKLRRIVSCKPALLFCSIYLLHLVALLYSSNWDYGLSTLRTRLPILFLTLVVVSSDPLPGGSKKWLFLVFSASITVVSFFSLRLVFWGDVVDFRELSPFISHIRLSLMVALSAFTLAYLARTSFRGQPIVASLVLAMAAWHVAYLAILQALSGIIVFAAVVGVFVLLQLPRLRPGMRVATACALVLAIAGAIGTGAWLWNNIAHQEDVDHARLATHSELGTPYRHLPEHPFRENGHAVYLYIADDELREVWNKASLLSYDSLNRRGEPVRHVLYRYMASLGLRKDACGFSHLGKYDVEAVEDGITNVLYTRWPWMLTRLHQTLWEVHYYRHAANPAGHSLTQRIEFWRAAWEAIKKKPVFGWGTGDIREASRYGLEQTGSPLSFERWMKPHNQYLSFAVLFGIPGALWILFAMTYPAVRLRAFGHFPFMAFYVILFVSMLNEDTIDTQAGLTFFVFFVNYFLFLREWPGNSCLTINK